jgi:aldose 1-epimerase
MERFLNAIGYENGVEVLTLIDQKTSTNAKIVPDIGNNLVSWTIVKDDETLELMWIPSEIKNLHKESRKFFGNPVLFPFPGRIPKGEFQFQNQTFGVPVNFSDGTAIHGFVYDKKWEVSEISPPSDKKVSVTSTYDLSSEIQKYFPFPFHLEMTYTLREYEIEIHFVANNVGDNAFPFGYGLHPYFRLHGKREDSILYFPATEQFILDELIPRGDRILVPEECNFQNEKSLDGVYLDDLFGDLKKNEGNIISWIRNSKTNFKLIVSSDQNFDYHVLFAPEWGDFICIEPYTCIPNAYNLANRRMVTGLKILEPGEMFQAKTLFKVEI